MKMVALGVTIFENGLRRFRNAAGLAQARTLDPVFIRPHAVRAERFRGGSVSDFPFQALPKHPKLRPTTRARFAPAVSVTVRRSRNFDKGCFSFCY